MDDQYLNRGESIILTTHRISVDSVLHNVMLTNERLVLIDDRHAGFYPRSIMLRDIASLRSGKMSSGEPVIILFFSSAERENLPLHLIFSQHYGEIRRQERDEWAKKIMELRIALIQKDIPSEISPTSLKHGLQPSVRHWIAPEKIRPLTSMGSLQPEPVPLTIIPDESDFYDEVPSEEIVFTTPAESGSLDALEQSAFQIIEPETAGDHPSEQLSSGKISEMAGESVLPEVVLKQPESPVMSGTPKESCSETLVWPVLERTGPQIADEYPAEQPSSGKISEMAGESVLPEVVSEQPESPVISGTPEESSSETLVWPVLERTGPQIADENPAEQPPSGEIPRTPLELALLSFLSEEKDPEFTRRSLTIALESLIPTRQYDKLSEDRRNGAAVGENPVEEIEMSTGVSPHKFQAPSPEGLEKPDTDSPFKIVTPSPEFGEPFHQRARSNNPEPALPESEKETTAIAIHPQQHSPLCLFTGQSGKKIAFIAGCIIFLILVFVGGAMFISSFSHKDNSSHFIPFVNTTPNVTLKMTPSPFLIPQSGLWVRVNSSANYLGQAGNPDLLKQVSGTGNQIYQILNSNGIVQVTVKKQDNSGSILSVEIYKDGTLLASRKVTAPMGSIDLLIDSKTGYPPGLTANGTITQDIS
jgi:hypothetical protein